MPEEREGHSLRIGLHELLKALCEQFGLPQNPLPSWPPSTLYMLPGCKNFHSFRKK